MTTPRIPINKLVDAFIYLGIIDEPDELGSIKRVEFGIDAVLIEKTEVIGFSTEEDDNNDDEQLVLDIPDVVPPPPVPDGAPVYGSLEEAQAAVSRGTLRRKS